MFLSLNYELCCSGHKYETLPHLLFHFYGREITDTLYPSVVYLISLSLYLFSPNNAFQHEQK